MQVRHVFQVLRRVVSYFYVLFPSSMLNHRPVCKEDSGKLPEFSQRTDSEVNNILVTEQKVKKKLLNLKTDKSQGPDGINPRVLKECGSSLDTGYPHDGRADKDSYPHDGRADKDSYPHNGRADKDSYPHDRHNQYIILSL